MSKINHDCFSYWSLSKAHWKLAFTQGHLLNVVAPSKKWKKKAAINLAVTIWTQEKALGSSTELYFLLKQRVLKAAQQWDLVPGNIFIGINKITNLLQKCKVNKKTLTNALSISQRRKHRRRRIAGPNTRLQLYNLLAIYKNCEIKVRMFYVLLGTFVLYHFVSESSILN